MIGTMFPELTDVLPITPVHIHMHLISLSLPELKLRHICLLASLCDMDSGLHFQSLQICLYFSSALHGLGCELLACL